MDSVSTTRASTRPSFTLTRIMSPGSACVMEVNALPLASVTNPNPPPSFLRGDNPSSLPDNRASLCFPSVSPKAIRASRRRLLSSSLRRDNPRFSSIIRSRRLSMSARRCLLSLSCFSGLRSFKRIPHWSSRKCSFSSLRSMERSSTCLYRFTCSTN